MFRCFLLTPKLLSDLQYSEACSILTIMNGPWIDEPSNAHQETTSFMLLIGAHGNSWQKVVPMFPGP
ncbi:hypothetical protein RJ639_004506 [Escallonia herrerae]|uniref:Uncharacterized protein n=1 Tax=Escallonia herrerae TaxID=1293975 RepID=A0AA88W473_9ASTE|nr:hypothetical protein RJ639_004506 [Escallonia herrerae]